MIPDAAVEALARVLADEALFDADCSGSGWDAGTDSSDHFMPSARKSAARYLEAAAPHMLAYVAVECDGSCGCASADIARRQPSGSRKTY